MPPLCIFNKMDNTNLGGWALGNKVVAWILANIPAGATVVEFGSGAGSNELGKTYKIWCVEHDPIWVGKYPNVNYIFAPIVDGWYARECLKMLPKDYALIIVDGPPAIIGRAGLLNVTQQLNTECPIIVDDTHRDPEAVLATELWHRLGKQRALFINETDKQATILT